MRRTLITLLVVITLLSQWGWVEHAYHEHLPDEVCEVCVSASGHVAVPPSVPLLPGLGEHVLVTPTVTATLNSDAPRYYQSRAPPRLL